MDIKRYRFYFHYYRQYKCLSVHYRGKCYKVKDIHCTAPVESKWNEKQPNLILRGFTSSLEIKDQIAYIQ